MSQAGSPSSRGRQVPRAAAAVAIDFFRQQAEQSVIGRQLADGGFAPIGRGARARDFAGQPQHLRAEHDQPPGQRGVVRCRLFCVRAPCGRIHDNLQLR
jgi:hypothetical protein